MLQKPSEATIRTFLDRSQTLPLSYPASGLVGGAPAGFDLDEHVFVVGHGRDAFDRARRALLAWKQFDFDWVELTRRQPTNSPGTEIAVLLKLFGVWSLNGGRVTSCVDLGEGGGCGLSYGTLTNHAECGEELFEVRLDPQTGNVLYRIRAVSRPRAALARLGRPVVRFLQARFRRDSAAAMTRAIAESGDRVRPASEASAAL